MADILRGLGIGGGAAAGVGFILGLLLIWWLEPPIADARHFLMLAPTIVAGTIGAIVGGIMGQTQRSKRAMTIAQQ